MRDDINSLIEKIKGDDDAVRQKAIANLMFLMDESTDTILKIKKVGDSTMSQNEQVEAIGVLLKLAESFKQEYSGLLFVVGKANPSFMIEPVQDFILKYANTMPNEMLYQALVALQNCMVSTDFKYYKVIKSKFKHEQLLTELKKINTQDSRLKGILHDAISNLEFFVSQPD